VNEVFSPDPRQIILRETLQPSSTKQGLIGKRETSFGMGYPLHKERIPYLTLVSNMIPYLTLNFFTSLFDS
jgi:hypothetical protein